MSASLMRPSKDPKKSGKPTKKIVDSMLSTLVPQLAATSTKPKKSSDYKVVGTHVDDVSLPIATAMRTRLTVTDDSSSSSSTAAPNRTLSGEELTTATNACITQMKDSKECPTALKRLSSLIINTLNNNDFLNDEAAVIATQLTNDRIMTLSTSLGSLPISLVYRETTLITDLLNQLKHPSEKCRDTAVRLILWYDHHPPPTYLIISLHCYLYCDTYIVVYYQ
jgi:hypothetical protein